MSVVGKYAEFAVSCRTKDHSEDMLHHAKRALIDWFGCTLPGGLEEPAVLMTKALDETGRKLFNAGEIFVLKNEVKVSDLQKLMLAVITEEEEMIDPKD